VTVDASALLYAIIGGGAGAADLRQRLTTEVCHAPHLIDAEVGNVLRNRVIRGELTPDLAEALLRAAPALIDFRHEHAALAATAWRLRNNVTFYDALYVALAAGLGTVLVTADKRLASATRLPCRVRLVG
jgi:predicted nucleic acid-binding protein